MEKKEVWTQHDEDALERLERVNKAGAYGGHPYFRGAVINGDQLMELQQKKQRVLLRFAETFPSSAAAAGAPSETGTVVSAADLKQEVLAVISEKEVESFVREENGITVRFKETETPLVREYGEGQMFTDIILNYSKR